MSLGWDAVVAHALGLPGAIAGTYYGAPSVAANGRVLISAGRTPGSFVLHIDRETKALLIETDPATYWQTPHYAGWPAVLVRADTADPARVLAMIAHAHAAAMAVKPTRRRRR